ncbi:extracellular solute-binding protein [Solwaraspora sp. WMMB335]|uniref:extracellular solute-binding protein n=1 Tax=Solwaraspora sp. WMMB335 TaxID=3404118 RepID=UPI003B95B03F
MDPSLAGAATNRRRFLGLVGLGATAMAGGGLLAGCSRQAGTEGAATNVDAISAVLPKYQPVDLVTPDITGVRPIADGYLNYPSELVKAVTDTPGGSGETITAMTPWWGPTPPGIDRNTYLQAVNAELGVPVDFSVQDGNTYADKLSAALGARDVPDLLCAPNWEIDKIPRFSDAVSALFEDLTDYLAGDAALAYPHLASFPTGAWQYAVWGGRLAAVPWPTDGPFPYALFYRKDLTDAAGVQAPKNIEELYEFGKAMTDPGNGVWAFGSVFHMVQMFYGVPGSQGGWRQTDGGGLEFKYETEEYRAALEFTTKLFAEGLVHPDVVESKGSDTKQLFNSGRLICYEDGVGAWRGMYSEQRQITPTFDMQPVPIFSATGDGDPIAWGEEKPVFYTFIKKGLGAERTEELLRVLNWCAAPFGSQEYHLRQYGVAGEHHTIGDDGSPVMTELGRQEIADQYTFIVGRYPAIVQTADVPGFVEDLLAYSNETVKYLESNPWAGIKLEFPANYSRVLQPTEDKILDVLRGRRPTSDLDQIISEWRSAGGDEGRDFFAKALEDNGR